MRPGPGTRLEAPDEPTPTAAASGAAASSCPWSPAASPRRGAGARRGHGVRREAPTDVAIAKTSDGTATHPGETIVYTITVTNVGRHRGPARRHPRERPAARRPDAGRRRRDGRRGPRPGRVASTRPAPTSPRPTTAARSRTPPRSSSAATRRAGDDANPANDSATHVVDVTGAACAPPVGRRERRQARRAALRPPGSREAMPQSQAGRLPRAAAARRVGGRAAQGAAPARPPRSRSGSATAPGAAAARRAHLTVRLPSGFSLAAPARARP